MIKGAAPNRDRSKLCISKTLLGGHPVPSDSLGVVLRDALTIKVHEAEVELRISMTLLCGYPKPSGSLCVVLRDAFAMVVHVAEDGLRKDVPLLGQWPPFLQGCGVIAMKVSSISFIEILACGR